MGTIKDIHNPWRDRLVPASFRSVVFHVEASQRQGGRRTVVHEYPKRNTPYSEDMGRHATKWTFTGYLILGDRRLPDLLGQIAALNEALDRDDAGTLVHPILGTMLCMCERWSYSDQRQRGGYVEYDMQFTEAGQPALVATVDGSATVETAAKSAEDTSVNAINSDVINYSTSGPGQVSFPSGTPL